MLVIFPLPPAPLITSGTTRCACSVCLCPVDSTLVSKKLFQLHSYSYWSPPQQLKQRGSSQELFFRYHTLEDGEPWGMLQSSCVGMGGRRVLNLNCTNGIV